MLDPTLARTFVGRIVFAALCDKLFDIDEKLQIVPQLATGYEWSADSKTLTIKLRNDVTFHDGEKLDAAAVKFNIERHKTMAGSNRSGELRPVTSVDVVDPTTVKLNLSAPFTPILAALADRAGMMVSPKAAKAEGANFGAHPVCSGPFKFVERVAQDRISFERYAGYWNKANVHFDKVVYTPIVDSTVRLANLRSGQFDIIERVAPSDIEGLKKDKNLKVARITEIGYQGITINVGKSDQAQKNPLGKDAKVREAFELSLDRAGIVQVVMDNEATIGNQWVAPTNAFYAKNVRCPSATSPAPRPCSRKRACRTRASRWSRRPPPTRSGWRWSSRRWRTRRASTSRSSRPSSRPRSTWPTRATSRPTCSPGAAAPTPTATSTASTPASSRSTTPATASPRSTSCSTPRAAQREAAERKKTYEQIAARVLKDRPIIYLYHRNWLWAYNAKLSGLRSVPDGLVRVTGLKMGRAPSSSSARGLTLAMIEFLVKRIATILPTLVFVSMLIFGLQQLLPGDPAVILAGEERDPNVVAYLHQKLHLDDPLPVRYGYWVGGVLRGDLGESVRTQQPVLDADRPEAAGDDRAGACWR